MTDDGIKVEPGFRESARLDLGMPVPAYASRLDISSPQGRAEIKKAVDACRERGLIRFPGDRAATVGVTIPAPISPALPKHPLAAHGMANCKICGRLAETSTAIDGGGGLLRYTRHRQESHGGSAWCPASLTVVE